jgi:hypothetical protein
MNNIRTHKTGRTLYNKLNRYSNYVNYLKESGYIHKPLQPYYGRDGWKHFVKRDMFVSKNYIIMTSMCGGLFSVHYYLDFNGRFRDRVPVDEFNIMNRVGDKYKLSLATTEKNLKIIFHNLDNAYRKFPFYKKLYLKVKGKFFKTLDNFKKSWESAVDNMFKGVLGGSATSLILTMYGMDRKV